MSMNLSAGPSSWDRDMQGMPGMDEEESNLAALGMHVTGSTKPGDDDEDDEDVDIKVKDDPASDVIISDDDADDAKKEEEEVDALEELDILAKKLKEEDAPAMEDIED